MSNAEIIPDEQPTTTGLAPAGGMTGMLPAAAAARMAEVQVCAMFAHQNPRSVTRALAAIEQACCRPRLAENSQYSYSKGGQEIRGPSIDLLKAIAVEWRNIQMGWEVVTTRRGPDGVPTSTIRAFAWDVERNVPASITFDVRHWIDKRNGGGRPCSDEREAYELMANMAARRLRKCLETIIPSDIVDDAVDWCNRTLAGKSGEPLIDRVKAAVAFLGTLGVTQAMIETRFQRNVDALTDLEVSKLRRIAKSLKDGVGTIEEHFPPVVTEKAGPVEKLSLDKMADALEEKTRSSRSPKKPAPAGDGDLTDAEKAQIAAEEAAMAKQDKF